MQKGKIPPPPTNAVALEIPLHHKIMKWCDEQWPRVKYIRARSDMESTIAEGCQDFTVFMPGGRTVCIECKAKDGKMKDAQLSWKAEMEKLGHVIHIVRSMEEFREAIKA